MWLGVTKHKKFMFDGLPKGYEITHEIRIVDRPQSLPPTLLHYKDKLVSYKYTFKLILYP